MPFLPIFPLKLVTYPNEEVNLHIFEDRYKQLINECFEEQKTFGMPVFINGKVMDYGTELQLVAIRKTYPDGRMDISCEGKRIFKITEMYQSLPNKMYSGADVEFQTFDKQGDFVKNMNILEKMLELYELLKINKKVPDDPARLQMFDIAHHIGFSIHQEYQILTLKTELERQDMVQDHLTNLIPMIEEMERLRERVRMNGHFKNIIPPKF